MKELEKIISNRYSCRAYDGSRTPSQEQIVRILEAARMAPSACNRQPWRFIVVTDGKTRDAVCRAYPREWFAGAAAYIIACAVPSEAWVRPYDGKNHADIDVAIAVEHICLEATAMGLGSCWVCHFEPATLREGLSLPESLVPVAIIPIGYPASDAVPAKNRKPLEDIVEWRR